MKKFILLSAVGALVFVGAVRGDDANSATQKQATTSNADQKTGQENAGAEEIQFDGGKLLLAWQTDNDGNTIKEFIPKGETLEGWTKLAAVREYPTLKDARGFAEMMVQRLQEDSPGAPSKVTDGTKPGEVVLDFVAWPKDKSFVEFNVWKFRDQPNGGLLAEQFAVREYKDPEGFLKNLKSVRERLVSAMAKDGLQVQAAPQNAN